MRDELKWLGDALGDVSDLDVMLEQLRSREGTSNPGSTACSLSSRQRREVARARLLGVLRGQRYVSLLDRLVEGAAAPPLTAAADRPGRDALPKLARRAWRKVARAGRALEDTCPDQDFHPCASGAKQARYAAEAVAPALGGARPQGEGVRRPRG